MKKVANEIWIINQNIADATNKTNWEYCKRNGYTKNR